MTSNQHPTRLELIRAAMRLFGAHGFEGASTREIALRADTNISSIAYHFGGKDGLRLACAEAVAETTGRIARTIPANPTSLSRAQARSVLRRLIRRLVTFLVTPSSEDMVGFLLRELAIPNSPALDLLYGAVIERRHRALCEIWAMATGADPDSEDTRLAVFSLVGQAAYFRLAAPVVQRKMGWSGYARRERRAISLRLLANLEAMLEASDA